MRSISLYLLLALSMFGCGAAPSSNDDSAATFDVAAETSIADEAAAGGLTRAEAMTVLDLVDDICGDTWCEGDHDFRFRGVVCNERTASCNLFFLMFPHGTAPTFASWRSCKTNGYAGFTSLVEFDASGAPSSLRWDYYEALTTCIANFEQRTIQ